MKILGLLCSLLLFSSLGAKAQRADSADVRSESSLVRSFVAPASLLVASALARPFDMDIQNARNSVASGYNHSLDDVLQVSPALFLLSVRACGVNGRSKSWTQMLTVMGVSTVITASFADGLKNTSGRVRPYSGYEENSFPSGHTLTAFSTATMLHKEYGQKSVWYSIGGYSMASFVGMSRILNNKHWASDVLAGAGLGILSAEVGYRISDCLHADKAPLSFNDRKPSFLSLNAIASFNSTDIDGLSNPFFRFNHRFGYGYSIEGAYFFSRYLGIGAKSSTIFDLYEMDETYFRDEANVENVSYGKFSSDLKGRQCLFMPGAFTSILVFDRLACGAKFLFGLGGAKSFNLRCMRPAEDGEMVDSPVLFDEYSYSYALEAGVYTKYLFARNFAVSLSTAYTQNHAKYQFYDNPMCRRDNRNISVSLGFDLIIE